jgi:hypothetical protein
MLAIVNRSLGAKNPFPPKTCRGTIINPAAVIAEFFKKSLRDGFKIFLFFWSSIIIFFEIVIKFSEKKFVYCKTKKMLPRNKAFPECHI